MEGEPVGYVVKDKADRGRDGWSKGHREFDTSEHVVRFPKVETWKRRKIYKGRKAKDRGLQMRRKLPNFHWRPGELDNEREYIAQASFNQSLPDLEKEYLVPLLTAPWLW